MNKFMSATCFAFAGLSALGLDTPDVFLAGFAVVGFFAAGILARRVAF